MNEQIFRKTAIKAVMDYFNSQTDITDNGMPISEDDVYVVWQCKILQNNKAMISTTIPDGMYYEFTWNGNKGEGYLDVYKKWKNVLVD